MFTHGQMRVMLKGRWRQRESLGQNVCEENTCEAMPFLLQIYSSLFLWKGGCKLGAKWKPKLAVSDSHLAILLGNFE